MHLTFTHYVNRVNGNPADFYDQNIKDLENSLSRQLTEKITSLSLAMKELKIIMSELFLSYNYYYNNFLSLIGKQNSM